MTTCILLAFCLMSFASPTTATALRGEKLLEDFKIAISVTDHPASHASNFAELQYGHCTDQLT